jgi:5'-3' exonuclease
MGVKGLKQFLLAKYPNVFTKYHLSHLSGKKVVVDIMTPLYKFKAGMGLDWKMGMLSFLLNFPKNNVHATILVDGPLVPIEKKEEQQKRNSARDKIKDKVSTLSAALEQYRSSGEVSDVFQDLLPAEATSSRNQLLGLEASIDVVMVENYIEKLKKQIVNISSEDMKEISELCRVLEISFYMAEGEAESMCSWLCKTGRADAIVSEDSDSLAYGAPVWISELDFQGNCMMIQIEDVYREMELSPSEFLDFCIMCGTDFNHRVEKLGPVNALALIKLHRTIEKICEAKKITGEEWNYDTVRRIFTHPCTTAIRSRKDPRPVEYDIRFNKVPNEQKVLNFLKEKRLPARYAREYFEQQSERFVFEE